MLRKPVFLSSTPNPSVKQPRLYNKPLHCIPKPRLLSVYNATNTFILSCLPSQPALLTTRSRAHALIQSNTPLSPLSSLSLSLTPTPPPVTLVPPALHKCISASDTDSDTPSTPQMNTSTTPLYVPAEVKQASPSSAPILTAGRLTIAVVCQFETACRCYFSVKDVTTGDCIGKIIYNFKSMAVQSWINAEEAQLLALPFSDFLITLKKKFLPRSWEDDLVQDQIIMQGNIDLFTWVNKIHNTNNKLSVVKSPYHIPTDCFWLHLIPRLSDRMKHLYKANNGTAPGATKGTLDAITDFKEWMECLLLLEQDLQVSRAGWVACTAKASNVL